VQGFVLWEVRSRQRAGKGGERRKRWGEVETGMGRGGEAGVWRGWIHG